MKRDIKFKYVVKKRDGDIITFILSLTEIQKRVGEWLVFNSLLDEIGLENYEIIDILLFTGLRDRNGKEICEGDILSFLEGRYKVCWSEQGAMFFTSMLTKVEVTKFCNTESWDMAEIIGNQFKNPELLK